MLDTEHDVHQAETAGRVAPSPGQGRIELRSVTRSFPVGQGEFFALRGVDLTVEPGELVLVVGRSGSGKSTLLNLIAGLDRPSSGTISVSGTALSQLSESERARFRGRGVGVVFQFFQLLPTLSVLENVTLAMELGGAVPKVEQRERARALLRRFAVLDQADKFPAELSGGEQQRVAIARALANDPPIVVADEPTGNLDRRTADDVFSLLAELSERGTTVVLVTHEQLERRGSGRTVELVDGLVQTSGGGAL